MAMTRVKFHLVGVALAALVNAPTCWAIAAGPIPVPVTEDNSCEFGFKPSLLETWENPEIRGIAENFGRVMLAQVLKYCVPGSVLTIGYSGKGYRGIPHDQYTIAALLCRRPEIKEQTLPTGDPRRPSFMFSCPIDAEKFNKFKDRQARGEPLWNRKEEFVPPRPGDDLAEGERLKALGLWKPPTVPSGPAVSPSWRLN